jgi:starch phosphorylase
MTPARLPPRHEGLRALAYNLWWSWHPEASSLFDRLDASRWAAHENPVRLLDEVPSSTLAALATDANSLRDLDATLAAFDADLARPAIAAPPFRVAYFSAEYAIARALPFYSGGLGVLAGDHLKSASDLAVPLVAVGLAYREGYFRQSIDREGAQTEAFPRHDFSQLPMQAVKDARGARQTVGFEFADRPVRAQIWRVNVGRVTLYLLDTDVDGNDPRDRSITSRLYGGDADLRVRQEIVLGILGLRALRAVGERPTVFHMNEGHAALLAFERARELRAQNRTLSWRDAIEASRRSMVFTTHTPVPAGNDVFDAALVEWYLRAFRDGVDVPMRELLSLARSPETDAASRFSMPVLALRTAGRANGVSAMHGTVARSMWRALWPDRDESAVPIGSVTNGVHAPTWLTRELRARLERDGTIDFARASDLSDHELWKLRAHRSERLLLALRDRIGPSATAALRSEALTLGFARRIATYKRASLLLRDPERLARLLTNDDRPVQLIVAGKAHPMDEPAKAVLREVTHAAADPRFAGRIVFVADYDMAVAHALVSGCDVWLNLPRRPLEASGTSGMKAGMNGVLNASVLDGWWCEGFAPELGWAIGASADAASDELQDDADAASLFETLEKIIVPAFFDRDAHGIPPAWCDRMRASIASIGTRFNSDRMVREYVDRYYLPANRDAHRLL